MMNINSYVLSMCKKHGVVFVDCNFDLDMNLKEETRLKCMMNIFLMPNYLIPLFSSKKIFLKKKIKMFKWFEWTQVLQTYTELNENITGPSKEAIGERGSDAKPLNRWNEADSWKANVG